MERGIRGDIWLLGLGVLYSLMAQIFYDASKEALRRTLVSESYMYPLVAGFLVFIIMIAILLVLTLYIFRER